MSEAAKDYTVIRNPHRLERPYSAVPWDLKGRFKLPPGSKMMTWDEAIELRDKLNAKYAESPARKTVERAVPSRREREQSVIDSRTGALIVLVHPGSLCGSLDMHAQKQPDLEPDATRYAIAKEVTSFQGERLCVVGEFQDEVPRYPEVQSAVDACTSEFYAGPWDSELKDVAKTIAQKFPGTTAITVTGAWADKGTGCVTTVAKSLKKLLPRAAVTVSPNAPTLES